MQSTSVREPQIIEYYGEQVQQSKVDVKQQLQQNGKGWLGKIFSSLYACTSSYKTWIYYV